MNEVGWVCGTHEGGERCAQDSSGETQGKEAIGEIRHRWEENIKMDLQEVGGVETGWSWLRIGTGGGHL